MSKKWKPQKHFSGSQIKKILNKYDLLNKKLPEEKFVERIAEIRAALEQVHNALKEMGLIGYANDVLMLTNSIKFDLSDKVLDRAERERDNLMKKFEKTNR